MAAVELVAAEAAHIPALAETMRDADMLECAAFGKSPKSALEHALASSLWALTAIEDGQPIAMLGVSPRSMFEGVGVPWMLGAERIYDNARALVKLCPPVIAEMQATFPKLENYVAADNVRAIAFLKHWNWEISERHTMIAGVPFVRFF